MKEQILNKLTQFEKVKDIHQYRIILDAAKLFCEEFPSGVQSADDLHIGIILLRELVSISNIVFYKEYENDFVLEKEIRYAKVKVFKLCIPESHYKLRGLTELLLGMKENSAG